MTGNFDRYAADYYPYRDDAAPLAPGAQVRTINLPVSQQANPQIGGQSGGFGRLDWYDRIHILPASIALGNLVSTQTRTVAVWNAWRNTAQMLLAINASSAEGIAMSGQAAPVLAFGALQERDWQIAITPSGPPTIDALLQWIFGNGTTVGLSVTGGRVVLWPFLPNTDYDETLSWKTDVIPSFNNEQRIALRRAPRQEFNHEFFLNEAQFSRAKAITTQWSHRVYAIAVWADVTKLFGGLAAGSTFIGFDTSNADYRDNDLVMLWVSDTQTIAIETTTITPLGINLKLPLEDDWPPCYIAPVRFARTLSGIDYKRGPNRNILAQGSFEVDKNVDLGNEGSYPVYRGKPVLTDRTAVIGDVRERIARTIEVFDNGSGPVQVENTTDWARHVQSIGFIKNTRQEAWALRKWLHARRGRQRAFWLPSWNADLTILEDVAETSSTITVSFINYPTYYEIKDILIQLKNRTRIFSRILSGATNAAGNDVLALSAQVGVAFPTSEIDFVSFLSHVRLDSDRITFNHQQVGQVRVSVPVVETPEL